MRCSATSRKWLSSAILVTWSLATQAIVYAADNPLATVRTWMYQIQGLEKRSEIDALAETRYDLLVIEPTFTLRGDEDFDAKDRL